MHCNGGKETGKKGLANACLYEILGFCSPSMKLQSSLDKTCHPRKNRKLHCSLKTLWDSSPKVRKPVPSCDAREDPSWSLRGLIFHPLALCRCFNCPDCVCMVSTHWAKLNASDHFVVKYLPIAPTVLLVCMQSLLWPWALRCSVQVWTAADIAPSLSFWWLRKRQEKPVYKSRRLLHLHRQQCRWQKHILALRAAFVCLSSAATSHSLCSCHMCLWLLCKHKVPAPSRLDLSLEGVPRVGVFLWFCPSPSAGVSRLHQEQHSLLHPVPASPSCRAPGLPISSRWFTSTTSPGKESGGLAHDEKWRLAWQHGVHRSRQAGSTTYHQLPWLMASTWGEGGGRRIKFLQLNESQMIAHSHFQAENWDVVLSLFCLYRRWWVHYPAYPIFSAVTVEVFYAYSSLGRGSQCRCYSPHNLSWLGVTVTHLMMGKVRHIRK